MEIRKAVIPAAGLGTRFLPVTKSVPKELLPILDKPMIQYVVEEAVEAGIQQVIIVTSPGKESIASFFQPRPDLDNRLAGSPELLDKVRHASTLAQVSFVIQEQPTRVRLVQSPQNMKQCTFASAGGTNNGNNLI